LIKGIKLTPLQNSASHVNICSASLAHSVLDNHTVLKTLHNCQ